MREVDEMQVVCLAVGFFDRLRGLFSKRAKGDVLLIAPCRSIHTFGMGFPIDIAFIDRQGTVIDSVEGLPPFRLRKCRGAFGVLERKASRGQRSDGPWFKEGEEIRLCIKK